MHYDWDDPARVAAGWVIQFMNSKGTYDLLIFIFAFQKNYTFKTKSFLPYMMRYNAASQTDIHLPYHLYSLIRQVGQRLAANAYHRYIFLCEGNQDFMGFAGSDRCWIFNSLDRQFIAKPFARGVVYFAEPIWIPHSVKGEEMEAYPRIFEERLNQGARWCDEQFGAERP